MKISPVFQQRITQNKYNINTQSKQSLSQTKHDTVGESSENSTMPISQNTLLAFATFKGVKVTANAAQKSENKSITTEDKLDKVLHEAASEIQATAKQAQKSAKNIKITAQQTIDETLKAFEEVEPLKNGTKVIENFADDGKTLTSRATLNGDVLTIDNFSEKTRIGAYQGDLRSFYRGCEFQSDELTKAEEYFHFEHGKLYEFDKGIKSLGGGVKKIEQDYTFYNGTKDFNCLKNWQFDADENESIGEVIRFNDGKISTWKKQF